MEKPSEIKKELIQDVESIFQLVITVSIFFLTVADILFKYANATYSQIGSAELSWVNVPVALVACYILFRVFRKRFRDWVLRTINVVLLLELLLIVIAVSVVLAHNGQIDSSLASHILHYSPWWVMSLPTFILIFSIAVAIFFKEKAKLS